MATHVLKWSDLDIGCVWSESTAFRNVTSKSAMLLIVLYIIALTLCCQQVVGLGLDNIVAIIVSDAVLVAHKDRAQDVSCCTFLK